jgi:hypothetical protein
MYCRVEDNRPAQKRTCESQKTDLRVIETDLRVVRNGPASCKKRTCESPYIEQETKRLFKSVYQDKYQESASVQICKFSPYGLRFIRRMEKQKRRMEELSK